MTPSELKAIRAYMLETPLPGPAKDAMFRMADEIDRLSAKLTSVQARLDSLKPKLSGDDLDWMSGTGRYAQ